VSFSCLSHAAAIIEERSTISIGNNDIFDIVCAMVIYLLTLDRVFDTGLAALQDSFAIADEFARTSATGFGRMTTICVCAGGRIRTNQGLQVPAVRAVNLAPPDIVVVPALGAKTPEALSDALGHRDIRRAGVLLRQWQAAGATIAAACTGTFVLAEEGLLDGKTSTTSWWLGPFFRSRYPAVKLDDNRMLVKSHGIITAGAALAHFDLALFLIRQFSPSVASLTARYLITDPRPSQANYVIPDHLTHNDPVVERFERWARQNLSETFCLRQATSAIGVSPRTLARKMKHVLGKSPLAYVQALRVERAVHLLQTTNDCMDNIAAKVGYADGVTLRALLRRTIGRSPGEIRRVSLSRSVAAATGASGTKPNI
jgi:transcriptional regulator GlxA family with amidase domain